MGEQIHLAINDTRQVASILHEPGDLVSLASHLKPATSF